MQEGYQLLREYYCSIIERCQWLIQNSQDTMVVDMSRRYFETIGPNCATFRIFTNATPRAMNTAIVLLSRCSRHLFNYLLVQHEMSL